MRPATLILLCGVAWCGPACRLIGEVNNPSLGLDQHTIALYHFDEGHDEDHPFQDSSRYHHHLVNAGTISIPSRSGFGEARDFEAASDHLVAPSTPKMDANEELTIEFLVFFQDTAEFPPYPSGISMIVGRMAPNMLWRLFLSQPVSGALTMTLESFGATPATSPSFALSVGTWHALAITHSSGIVRFYVDGIEIGSASTGVSQLFSNESDLFIGSFQGSDQFFGALDEIRISDTVRTIKNSDSPF